MKLFCRLLVASLLIVMVGCESMPHSGTWITTTSKDKFTDEVTKMVTTDPSYQSGYLKLCLFVGTRGDLLAVGVRSAGQIRVPVGAVQIRVDDNVAWSISTDETPASMMPGLPSSGVNTNMQAQIMENMTKIMSPYTCATGDKARQIIKQMAHGNIIRFRSVALNQPGSTTGEVKVDSSFIDGLKSLGIDPESQ